MLALVVLMIFPLCLLTDCWPVASLALVLGFALGRAERNINDRSTQKDPTLLLRTLKTFCSRQAELLRLSAEAAERSGSDMSEAVKAIQRVTDQHPLPFQAWDELVQALHHAASFFYQRLREKEGAHQARVQQLENQCEALRQEVRQAAQALSASERQQEVLDGQQEVLDEQRTEMMEKLERLQAEAEAQRVEVLQQLNELEQTRNEERAARQVLEERAKRYKSQLKNLMEFMKKYQEDVMSQMDRAEAKILERQERIDALKAERTKLLEVLKAPVKDQSLALEQARALLAELQGLIPAPPPI